MNKHYIVWHGKSYYFIGTDADGIKQYLEEAKFDCGWYWGIGYIETFSNNKNPQMSRDIRSHTHWDSLFDSIANEKRLYHLDAFNELFQNSPFTDGEKWKIIEIMRTLYTARKYSDMLHIGGSHVTANPCADIIKNDDEYNRINKVVIPKLLEELYSILFAK